MACERPERAVVLFDGSGFNGWRHRGSGAAVQWRLEGDAMVVVPGSGDIVSTETFADALLHLEFRVPDMPEAKGQGKGNSGIFLQGRYEIQVLDSHGWARPGKGDCGAIYNQHAPLLNACRPPLQWQSYDIAFRAARVGEGGEVQEAARVTVAQNGLIIHNNVVLQGVTGGAADQSVGTPGPLRLQDHRNTVAFRNIWLLHLPASGSDQYAPQ
jgi:hypothetical protein